MSVQIVRSSVLKMVLVFVVCMLVEPTVDAQLLNKLKDRAIQKASDRVEDRILKEADKKMDSALDTLENKVFDDSDSQQNSVNETGERDYNINININDNTNGESAENLNAMLGQLSQMTFAEYEKIYTFQHKIVIDVSSTDKKDEAMNMTQFVGQEWIMILIDSEEESRIISDYKNNSMLIMNDKDFSGTAISMDFMEGAMQGMGANAKSEYYDEDYMNATSLNCNETGKTKNVAGYTCKNWVCENDSVHFDAWYTDEVLFDFQDKKWGKIGNMFSMNHVMDKMRKGAEGTVLEVVYYDKIEKETVTFKVVELDLNAKLTFETGDYNFPAAPTTNE